MACKITKSSNYLMANSIVTKKGKTKNALITGKFFDIKKAI